MSTRTDLLAAAAKAAGNAAQDGEHERRHEQVETAKLALEAAALCPLVDEPDVDETLVEQLDRYGAAYAQLDGVVASLIDTWESAGSETSLRLAARVRGQLDQARDTAGVRRPDPEPADDVPED